MKIAHLLLLLAIPIAGFSQAFKPAALFNSNMVLQQQAKAPIWGKGLPNQKVTVSASWGETASTATCSNGHWQVLLNTPAAGGPFEIRLESQKETILLTNVMVGEVWVCAGQSNMEMTLAGWPPNDTISYSSREISLANHPNLRFVSVMREYSLEPRDDIKGYWEICTPQAAKSISATAYYFGIKLQEMLKVPVGLIIAAWGGSPAEAWATPSSLEQNDDFRSSIKKYSDAKADIDAYMQWLERHPKQEIKSNVQNEERWLNLDFEDNMYASRKFNDKSWYKTTLPRYFESIAGDFDGVVWCRRTVNLPKDMASKPAQIAIGKVDDMDRVYVNGTLIGATERPGAWNIDRAYDIPSDILKKGENTIAIRVLDNGNGGGVWGDTAQFYIKSEKRKISLHGEWKIAPTAELYNTTFYLLDSKISDFNSRPQLPFKHGPTSPGLLFNGMINPLIPFALKGVIWYQGESNVGRSSQYEKLFPEMIRSWRTAWGQVDFPFYFVQIAPYTYSGANKNEAALLRDAQRRCLITPNTGMAITMDVGSSTTIHPGNKKEVGSRLAALALANNYGMDIPKSGPLFRSLTLKKNIAIVEFDHAEGLTLTGNPADELEVAGSDGVYYPANAFIKDNRLIVNSPKVDHPLTVRYGFKNASKSILQNKAKLPASTFSTESVLK